MGVRGFVYLSYPTLELIQQLDHDKVVRTLDYTWVRNKQGEGMIGFVANWFALADTHLGRGEHALSVMRHNLKCVDKWGTSLTETPGSGNYYFATGYASFILVPLSMAVQSARQQYFRVSCGSLGLERLCLLQCPGRSRNPGFRLDEGRPGAVGVLQQGRQGTASAAPESPGNDSGSRLEDQIDRGNPRKLNTPISGRSRQMRQNEPGLP